MKRRGTYFILVGVMLVSMLGLTGCGAGVPKLDLGDGKTITVGVSTLGELLDAGYTRDGGTFLGSEMLARIKDSSSLVYTKKDSVTLTVYLMNEKTSAQAIEDCTIYRVQYQTDDYTTDWDAATQGMDDSLSFEEMYTYICDYLKENCTAMTLGGVSFLGLDGEGVKAGMSGYTLVSETAERIAYRSGDQYTFEISLNEMGTVSSVDITKTVRIEL